MIKEKKGQIQISFGMIFSIIIIIATVAIAFYVITYFLDLSNCQKNGAFWDSLNKEVYKAWNSDSMQEVYKAEVPSGITKVCFGNFTQMAYGDDKVLFTELERYEQSKRNAYLYPPGKACEDLAYFNIEHSTTAEFFCVPVASGKINVKISKTSFDALVKLSKP
jgi:hypothetical protein